MVVSGGFEPPTSTMSTWRSTTKLTDYISPKLKSELKEYRKFRYRVKFDFLEINLTATREVKSDIRQITFIYPYLIHTVNIKLLQHNFQNLAKCNYLKLKAFMAQKLIC